MGNTILKNLISIVILISVFITGNGINGLFFTYYWYYVFYILFFIYGIVVYRKINIKILLSYLCLIIYASLTIQFGMTGFMQATKQLINIGISLFVFYFFLVHENFDLEKIIRNYISVSKVILIIGFIQVFLFTINQGQIFLFCFPFLKDSNISFRLQSLTQEPSFLALLFAPVVFISVYTLVSGNFFFITRLWSVLFILGYVLTVSISAFFGITIIFFIVVMKMKNLRSKLAFFLMSISLALAFLIVYNNFSLLKVRIQDTMSGLQENITVDKNYEKLNLSSYAFLSNIEVMRCSLREYPFTGNGLGSNPLSFEKYLPDEMVQYSDLNKEDASSMTIRLLSETGIIGLTCFIIFVIRYRISVKDCAGKNEVYWVINSGILVMIFIILLRNGNYTIHGKLLFLMIYYFTFEKLRDEKKNNSGISHIRA